jgi:hypothetical protein
MNSRPIHNPFPPFSHSPLPGQSAGQKQTQAGLPSVPRSAALLPVVSSHPRVPRRPALSAIRMQCLRLLQSAESLTACEAALRLGLDAETVRSQLGELLSLRLVEKAGVRTVNGRVQPVFELNPSHPVLELLLGPAPDRDRHPAGP